MEPVVYCADVGSIEKENFGWARAEIDENYVIEDPDIDRFCQRISRDLNEGRRVAIGYECPLFLPLRDEPEKLLKARTGEGDRSWSCVGGLGSLASGLVETIYSLREIKKRTDDKIIPHLNWGHFTEDRGRLFIWEAFITGSAKSSADDGREHSEDAARAVEHFIGQYPDISEADAISEKKVHSLIGASLLRTGWVDDADILKIPNVVLKPDRY